MSDLPRLQGLQGLPGLGGHRRRIHTGMGPQPAVHGLRAVQEVRVGDVVVPHPGDVPGGGALTIGQLFSTLSALETWAGAVDLTQAPSTVKRSFERALANVVRRVGEWELAATLDEQGRVRPAYQDVRVATAVPEGVTEAGVESLAQALKQATSDAHTIAAATRQTSGDMTTTAAPAVSAAKPNYLLWGGVALGVVLVGGAAYYFLSRR